MTQLAGARPAVTGPSPAIVAAQFVRPRRGVKRRRDIGIWFALGWLGLIIVLALTVDLLPVRPPDELTDLYGIAPGTTWREILGTDQLGRSQLSRSLYGARVSLAVAIGAAGLAMVVGTLVGMVVGYVGKATESVFEVLTNALLAFPPLILLIALAAVLEPSLWTLVVSLSLLAFPVFARIARANTLAYRNREFVVAARAMGATHTRLLLREILPNVLLPVLSYAMIVAATLMVAEGSLSFLGLGVPPPTPSWGGMIAAGRSQLDRNAQLILVPSVFFFLTVFSLNRVGDWARGRFGKGASL